MAAHTGERRTKRQSKIDFLSTALDAFCFLLACSVSTVRQLTVRGALATCLKNVFGVETNEQQ
jgi:hypothetical protein